MLTIMPLFLIFTLITGYTTYISYTPKSLTHMSVTEKDTQTLKVAVNAAYEPFEYYERDELIGFDIELMDYIGDALDYEIEYVDMDFDKLFMSVDSGKADCAISAIAITEERKSYVHFSEPYIYANETYTYSNGSTETNNHEYAIAISPHLQDLADEINSALEDAENDGTLEYLFEKYDLKSGTFFGEAYCEYSLP